MYKLELEQLESKLNSLNSELNSLSGQCELLTRQIENSNTKLSDLTHKREVYRKSVELLTLVQKTTNNKTKKGFEIIITNALRYILNDTNYELKLNFERRGNLQELYFNIKTPECQEFHDPLDSLAGGVLDVLSLALRVSLLEMVKPKIEGFLALDEPFKHLSTEYLEGARLFIKALNKRINRQIIMVTHKEEMLANADNIIEIGDKK